MGNRLSISVILSNQNFYVYLMDLKNGENNSVFEGVSLPPFPSHRAQRFSFFTTPSTLYAYHTGYIDCTRIKKTDRQVVASGRNLNLHRDLR